jgi:hypothetical protein
MKESLPGKAPACRIEAEKGSVQRPPPPPPHLRRSPSPPLLLHPFSRGRKYGYWSESEVLPVRGVKRLNETQI